MSENEKTYLVPSNILIEGDLESILASAPSKENLIAMLNLGDKVSAADQAILQKMLFRWNSGPQTALTTTDGLVSINKDSAAVVDALQEYEKDLASLQEFLANDCAEIKQAVKVAFASLRMEPNTNPGNLGLKAVLAIRDSQESAELQRLNINLNLIQTEGEDEALGLKVPISSAAALAWKTFQSTVQDHPFNIFTSGFSPIRSIPARKVRLAAIVCRYLVSESKNQSGDSVNYLTPDLVEIKAHRKDWPRLENLMNGKKVRAIKNSQNGPEDKADRGDGGISGSAKDGKRYHKALRKTQDITRSATLENDVKKGNALEALELISAEFKKLAGFMTSSKMNKEYSEAFIVILQNGGGQIEDQIFPSIYKAGGILFKLQKNSDSSLYRLINKSPFEKIRRGIQLSQAKLSEGAGPLLAETVQASEKIVEAMRVYWESYDSLISSVRAIRGGIQTQISEASGLAAEALPAFIKAATDKAREKLTVTAEPARAAAVRISDAAGELNTAADLLEAFAKTVREEPGDEAKSEGWQYSAPPHVVYERFAGEIRSVAKAIQAGAIETIAALDATEEAEGTRINSAIEQFLRTFGAEKEVPLHEIESAILKATELKSVDWTVGNREEFPEWMTDSKEILKRFGINATELGKAISSNAKQTKNALLKVAVSMDDIAKILNFDQKAVSLGGRISISLGARGKHDSIAYYDRMRTLLAFKNGEKGDGSFIHEWFHAFDMAGSGNSALETVAGLDGVDEDVKEGLKNLKSALLTGGKEGFLSHITAEKTMATSRLNWSIETLEDFKKKELKNFMRLMRESISAVMTITSEANKTLLEVLDAVGISKEKDALFYEKVAYKISMTRLRRLPEVEFGQEIFDNCLLPASNYSVGQTLSRNGLSSDSVSQVLETLAPFFRQRNEALNIISSINVAIDRLFDPRASSRGVVARMEHNIKTYRELVDRLNRAEVVALDCTSYKGFTERFPVSTLPSSLRVPGSYIPLLNGGWPSKMYLDSAVADRATNKNYWSSLSEMGARAFEVYGTSKMGEAELENSFLIDADRTSPRRSENGPQIYPSGEHAKSVIDAVDALMTILRKKGRLNIR